MNHEKPKNSTAAARSLRGEHVDWDDDNDEAAAALLGGVIGLGVGAMLANEDDPGYMENLNYH